MNWFIRCFLYISCCRQNIVAVRVLVRAAQTCCVDEAASELDPAVVCLLNALQGEMQQIEAQFPIMHFKPAVVSVQRNCESCSRLFPFYAACRGCESTGRLTEGGSED